MNELDEKINKIMEKLSKYSFVLGVVDDKKRKKKQKGEENMQTNSEILEMHELGSPIKKIPARPILGFTIRHKYINDLMDEAISNYVALALENKDKQAHNELERTALRIERFIRKTLMNKEHNFKKLSPKTIMLKGSDLPLYDTGQLAKNIVCILKIK